MRILLDVETNNGQRGLGDILILTPVIQALSETYCCKVDMLIRKEAQVILENNPYVRFVTSANVQDYDLRLFLEHKVEDYSRERNRQPRVDAMAELFGVRLGNKKPQLFIEGSSPLDLKDDKINIGISIESTAVNRTWPSNYLAELIKDTNCRYYLFGLISVELPDLIDCTNLSLRETILAVREMNLIITTDSFLSHVAAAGELPSIVIYTSINSDWRCRYYDKCYPIQSPIECSPCQDQQEYDCPDVDNPPCVISVTPAIVKKEMQKCFRQQRK